MVKKRHTKRGTEVVISLGEYEGLRAQVEVRTEQCQQLQARLQAAQGLAEAAEQLSSQVEELLEYFVKLMGDVGLDLKRVPDDHVTRTTARALTQAQAALESWAATEGE